MSRQTQFEFSVVYYRLIALWVLCEAMLGGIIHGLRIPVSGLLVGSCAIICICLIAWYVPVRHAIIKATLIVAIFKMILSPQAPFPAYIAVFFQGVAGELLFFNRRVFRISCVLLAMLALLESGLQRILVLTIIYGNDLWVAVNGFINGLTKQKNTSNYSLIIGGLYVGAHLITGFLVGLWAAGLPGRIEKWSLRENLNLQGEAELLKPGTGLKKQKRFRILLFLIWILLSALYIQSYFHIGKPLLPSHVSLKILLRSIIIVLTWIFIVGPLLKMILYRWLQKKQSRLQQEVKQVIALIPAMQQIIVGSWKKSASGTGLRRLGFFSKIVLINTLREQPNKKIPAPDQNGKPEIVIFSAPVQSGKTSSLLNWIGKRDDVFGILTPVVGGKRMFMNISDKDSFPMEAGGGEAETLAIGRFIFSKNNFEQAAQIISESINTKGWLVIDEIGPLELKGKGFHQVLKNVIARRKGKLLLVVREGLTEQVISFFGIENGKIIHSGRELS